MFQNLKPYTLKSWKLNFVTLMKGYNFETKVDSFLVALLLLIIKNLKVKSKEIKKIIYENILQAGSNSNYDLDDEPWPALVFKYDSVWREEEELKKVEIVSSSYKKICSKMKNIRCVLVEYVYYFLSLTNQNGI